MFDNLKRIDIDLHEKYIDIEKNISSYSRTVYVSMQSFCESILKWVANAEAGKIKLEFRETLGSLLGNSTLCTLMTIRYNYDDFDRISSINSLGNSYKHGTLEIVEEETIYQSLSSVGDLILAVLNRNKLKTADFITRPYFAELLHKFASKDELNSVKDLLDNKTVEVSKLKEEIENLEKEKSILQSNLTISTEIKHKAKPDVKTRDAILKRIDQIAFNIDDLRKDNKSLLDKLSQSHTVEEEEQLASEQDAIVTAILELEKEREVKLAQLREYDSAVRKDTSSIDENKYQILIDDLNNKIDTLQKQAIATEAGNKIIKKVKNNGGSYDEKSRAFNEIRVKGQSSIFASNYVNKGAFTLFNVSMIDSCVSRFKSVYAVIFNLLTRGKLICPSLFLQNQQRTEDDLIVIYQFQILVLLMLKNGILADDEWKICLDSSKQPLFQIAVDDIWNWSSLISELSRTPFVKPNFFFSDQGIPIKLASYSEDRDTYVISQVDDPVAMEMVPIWIAENINYAVSSKNGSQMIVLNTLLKNLFGFDRFREGQIEILINFLNGNSTIGILPTGGGKSLTYYMSVMLQPKASLIIAPINSLIKDQIDKLNKQFGILRTCNLTRDNANGTLEIDLLRFRNSEILFSFASPERAQNKDFRASLVTLSYNRSIGSVILDEVHCLSEWGHDFRIAYLMLSVTLNTYCEGIRYLGLTATASVNVVNDLLIELNIRDKKNLIFSRNLKRMNLNFQIRTHNSFLEMQESLKKILVSDYGTKRKYDITRRGDKTNAVIVFSQTIKSRDSGVETLYNLLSTIFPNETALFYGKNKQEQDAFMSNEKTLLIATKAFGMGVDKPNIRLTCHFGMPGSREAFYQEAGRAGRDGLPSDCLLLSLNNQPYVKQTITSFLKLDTSIEKLRLLNNDLKFSSDISTLFFFLMLNLETPEEETAKVVPIYNNIAQSQSRVIKIDSYMDSDGQVKIDKYLYILHKIGIVNNWYLVYYGVGGSISYFVERNSNYADIDFIVERAKAYMKPYSPNDEDLRFFKKIKSLDYLDALILGVRQWYHNTFIRGRRQQLANMYDFVNNHMNKNDSNSIQEELDKFFDLSNWVGESEEGLDIGITNETFGTIVNMAFSLESDKLLDMQISLERLLESVVNYKVDIYTSLVALRIGTFENSRNGKERFEFAISRISQAERNEVMNHLIPHYMALDDKQKKELLNAVSNIDKSLLRLMFDKISGDFLVDGLICSALNAKLDSLWRNNNGN